jgi:hypothetical protein
MYMTLDYCRTTSYYRDTLERKNNGGYYLYVNMDTCKFLVCMGMNHVNVVCMGMNHVNVDKTITNGGII